MSLFHITITDLAFILQGEEVLIYAIFDSLIGLI